MMGKDEAVLKLARVGHISEAYAEDLYDSFFEKPVVPQYVADWYEGNKDKLEEKIYQEVCRAEKNFEEGCLTDFQEWMIGSGTKPFEILVNMHQFGYEVEEEKRYTVRVKGIDGYGEYLNNNLENQRWFFASDDEIETYKVKHTRKELEEANFSWVFDCEGIEIEEVE